MSNLAERSADPVDADVISKLSKAWGRNVSDDLPCSWR